MEFALEFSFKVVSSISSDCLSLLESCGGSSLNLEIEGGGFYLTLNSGNGSRKERLGCVTFEEHRMVVMEERKAFF